MIRWICIGILAATPLSALEVPSGQPVTLHEVLIDQVSGEDWVRFRFIAPQIARGGAGPDGLSSGDDMQHLCSELAVPYLREHALNADVIVVSFADRETEFGVADPDATQFFEAFRLMDDLCIWEGF